MLLSRQFAKFVLETDYDSIPQTALQRAKHHIIDCLGCMLAGTREPLAGILGTYLDTAGGKPQASILGSEVQTSIYNAAMVNGTLGHALDFDDMSSSLIGHPTTVILPTILALGEYQKISARKALEAYVLGVEVACALGRLMNPGHYQRGWHPTTSLGIFGATAAAGKLLGVSEEELSLAFGIAASESSGIRENFGTMTKPFHAGRASAKGFLSAMLARTGFNSSDRAFEGDAGFLRATCDHYDIEETLKTLGNPYEFVSPGLSIKKYPSCGATSNGIDAMISLAEDNAILPDSVKSIECGSVPIAKDVLIYEMPRNGLEGKFSMHFCLAVALAEKKVTLEHFHDPWINNPTITDLVNKTTFTVAPELAEYGYRGTFNTLLKVSLFNGDEHVLKVDHAKGSPENPLSEAEVFEKYTHCAEGVLPDGKIERSIEMLSDFPLLEDLSDLLKVLRK